MQLSYHKLRILLLIVSVMSTIYASKIKTDAAEKFASDMQNALDNIEEGNSKLTYDVEETVSYFKKNDFFFADIQNAMQTGT